MYNGGLSQTVFVRSNNEVFKRTNTHTHTDIHSHTDTYTPTNAIVENTIRWILLNIRHQANTPWCILAKDSSPSFLRPLEIVLIGIVRPMERPYAPFYLLAIAMFALFFNICKKFAIEMCMILTLTFRMDQWNINVPMARTCATYYLLAIAMCALSVSICKKFAIEMCLTVTFRLDQC